MRLVTTVIGIGIFVVFNGCEVGCGNEVISSIESPRGGRIAVIFNRNCGATTDFNTQISVLTKGDAFSSEGGNTFIAAGSLALSIQWTSESELMIKGHQGARIFKQENLTNGVVISYE
jgi:uncharacterized Zn-binding protein involved in type VI secretion